MEEYLDFSLCSCLCVQVLSQSSAHGCWSVGLHVTEHYVGQSKDFNCSSWWSSFPSCPSCTFINVLVCHGRHYLPFKSLSSFRSLSPTFLSSHYLPSAVWALEPFLGVLHQVVPLSYGYHWIRLLQHIGRSHWVPSRWSLGSLFCPRIWCRLISHS